MRVQVPPCAPSILLLGALALVQFFCVPGHYLGFEHDDIQYVLASRSLLSGSYSLGIIPGDPPLTATSPGWPLLLTPAAALSGDHALGYQLWAWGWMLLCDVFGFLWLRRRLGASLAGAATAFFALNPVFLSRAGVVMNEIPTLALALGIFLLLDREEGIPGWASGLLLGFAWLMRTASLPLVPAVLGWYASRKRWKDAGLAALIWAAAVFSWKLWSDWGGAGLAESSELGTAFGGGGLEMIARVAAANAQAAALVFGESLLPWRPSPETAAASAVGSAAWVLSAAGLWSRLRERGYDAGIVYLGAAIVLHLFWPFWYQRYFPPLLPVLALGLAATAARLGRPALLISALALISLPGQGFVIARSTAGRFRPELAETYSEIRQNSPADALFASPFYCRDAWYSGRSFVPLPLGDSGGLAERMGELRIGFVLWQGIPDLGSSLGEDFQWNRMLSIAERELGGESFALVYRNQRENSVIYALRTKNQSHVKTP